MIIRFGYICCFALSVLGVGVSIDGARAEDSRSAPTASSEFRFSSPGLSALRLRLPAGFVESTAVVYAGVTSLAPGLSIYCLPGDAEIMARMIRAEDSTTLPRLGCVIVKRIPATGPDGESFNVATGQFAAQADVERKTKVRPTKRLPQSRVFGIERKEIRGAPTFMFSEEWTAQGGVTVLHYLQIFEGKDVWEVSFTHAADNELANALWGSLVSGL